MSGMDIIIIGAITILVGIALWKIRRDKKAGAPCSGCSACPAATNCHVVPEELEIKTTSPEEGS